MALTDQQLGVIDESEGRRIIVHDTSGFGETVDFIGIIERIDISQQGDRAIHYRTVDDEMLIFGFARNYGQSGFHDGDVQLRITAPYAGSCVIYLTD